MSALIFFGQLFLVISNRSSFSQVFYRIAVSQHFANFFWKTFAFFSLKRTLLQVLSLEFCKMYKATLLKQLFSKNVVSYSLFWSLFYQSTNLLKIIFLFSCFLQKNKKNDKSEFVTKFLGSIVAITLLYKVSKKTSKIVATQCFLTDRLRKTLANKRTYFSLPRQLLLFEAFRISWFVWQSISDHF